MPRNGKVIRNVKLRKSPILVLLAIILALISLMIIMFIFFVKDDLKKDPNPQLVMLLKEQESDNLSSNINSDVSSDISSDMAVNTSSSVSSDMLQDVSSSTSSDKEYHTIKVKVETEVPKTVSIEKSYFDDAVFIGDSISKGLKLYGILDDKNVVADQNVNLYQLYNNDKVYYINNKDKVTVWDAIAKKQSDPKKIYILLGSNGIPGLDNDLHITYYYDLVKKMKNKYPNAILYVASVTPITKDSSYTRTNFNMTKINAFNELVIQMAKDENIYYLDAASFLKDENGYLKSDYASSDGLHLTAKGHNELFKFYRTHAVSTDGYATIEKSNDE